MVLVLASSSAFADWTKIPSAEFSLSPPPQDESRRFKEDFKVLQVYQEERSTDDCKLAGRQRFPTFENFFKESDILTEEEYQASLPLMRKVVRFSVRVANYMKSKHKRARPYVTDESLRPCVHRPGGDKSYPSSHAAAALAATCVLSEIYPAKAKQLTEYGYYLGELRAIVGVHHPSDVEAGQDLAMQICNRLKSEEDFKSQLP